MKKNKKGFTLVELSIVIALIGIIVTMAVTFIVTYYQQVSKLAGDNDTIGDLSEVQRITREWIAYYDSNHFNIVVADEGGRSELTTYGIDISVKARLYFDPAERKLVWQKTDGTTESYSFSQLTDIRFEAETVKAKDKNDIEFDRTKMVICTAAWKKGTETHEQDLFFTVFTGIQRFRLINPDRL